MVHEWMKGGSKEKGRRELGPSGSATPNARDSELFLASSLPPMAATRMSFRAISRVSRSLGATRPWTCTSCLTGRLQASRGMATTQAEPFKKPYYVTTPIFYVNAGKHPQ